MMFSNSQLLIFPSKMILAQTKALRKNAVQEMIESDGDSQAIIVQIYNIVAGKNDKLLCMVSDGMHSIKAFIKSKGALQVGKSQFAIIKVMGHCVADSGKKIGISEFEVVCEYPEMIGKPKDFDKEMNPQEIMEYAIDLNKAKGLKVAAVKLENSQKQQKKSYIKTESTVKKQEKRQSKLSLPPPSPLNGKVNDYETIKGLFVGLKNWHLLCRIVKLDYDEFKAKKTGKDMKILNIELMDRSNVKISGTFFGEAAQKFRDYLNLGSVYKISQGMITNEEYNSSKNEKISPFKLSFNINSIFEEVSDVKIIANQQDAAITLNQVLQKGLRDTEFDIIAILVDIDSPVEFQKAQKTITKRNWIVADPIRQVTMQAVLWNDKIKEDRSMIGRTILLNRFSLHDYNGSLTLNTKPRSSIQLVVKHEYQQFEQKVENQYKSYENLSERRGEKDDGTTTVCKSIAELQTMIKNMSIGDTIKSDLNVWVSRMAMKKWYYDGCPHCNKSAEKNNTCNHCSKFVDATIPHFIMGIQIADPFGSLWTTAYDEFGKKIFNNEEGVIIKLLEYKQNELKEVVQNYTFQQFKLRLYTKKDEEGRIKHNVGKLADNKSMQKLAQENVQRIKSLMGLQA